MIPHPMSKEEYFSCHYYSERRPRTLEVLAFARYDELIASDHDNFIAFIYECFRERLQSYQHYAEVEENEFLTYDEAFHIFLENNFFAYPDCTTVRDYICMPQPDVYSPYFHIPLIYDYDPSYDYTQRA